VQNNVVASANPSRHDDIRARNLVDSLASGRFSSVRDVDVTLNDDDDEYCFRRILFTIIIPKFSTLKFVNACNFNGELADVTERLSNGQKRCFGHQIQYYHSIIYGCWYL
jgi:hypothetical protein